MMNDSQVSWQPSFSNHHDNCSSGNLLTPLIGELFSLDTFLAIVYCFLLLYLFLGIAIISDIFMCSIETITSQTRTIKVKSHLGFESEERQVKIWNDAVANLTLMALGSSAPEILLSIIEIVGSGFNAGELGAGTIVGSAAFNLLIITAVCITALPDAKVKRIEEIKVFAVTSFFSIFAYIWLFIILVVISPDVVELWEAILTFIYFPTVVLLSYAADKNFFRDRKTLIITSTTNLTAETTDTSQNNNYGASTMTSSELFPSGDYFPKGKITKKSLAKFVRDLRKVDPTLTDEDAACLAATYIFENESHSQLFYRVSACRQIAGSRPPLPHLSDHLQNVYDLWKCDGKRMNRLVNGNSLSKGQSHINTTSTTRELNTVAAESASEKGIAVVQFSSSYVAVLENSGQVQVTLQRFGRMDNAFSCMVQTLDRTAIGGVDYRPLRARVHFDIEECEKVFSVEIIDNQHWNPDKMFLIRLSLDGTDEDREDVAKGRICLMTVIILDDDDPGIVSFSNHVVTVGEGSALAVIPLRREYGSDGEVTIRYKTADGSAKSGKDYEGGEGEVTFSHGETMKNIVIPLSSDLEENKDIYFEVLLTSASGGAQLGKIQRTMVTVINADDYHSGIGKVFKQVKVKQDDLRLFRDAWIEQFWSALKVDLPDNGTQYSVQAFLGYILHVLSFFWKVIFAAIPPVGIWGGWLTFFCSLAIIGLLTALVGDVASTFGCLIGLEKSINAITLVAMGTSLPDLFASRTATRMERTADNAIGNVTGSNSVNVFLGLGLPWMIASIHWTIEGEIFYVPSGGMGFSVAVYTAVAVAAIIILIVRRFIVGGEVGGRKAYAYLSAGILTCLWLIYIALSVMNTYGILVV